MSKDSPHIVLIGAGIMSATLGVMLNKLLPGARISLYERLNSIAAESSEPMNNAGTGHSAFCELNYTPLVDGNIDISTALDIARHFETSKQFWAWLVESGSILNETHFISAVPHMSFVWDRDNVDFLQKRFEAMRKAPLFQDMQYTADPGQIEEWAPLIMDGRDKDTPMAVTRMDAGTDVNFGAITRDMINFLDKQDNVDINLRHKIKGFTKLDNGQWKIRISDWGNNDEQEVTADYIFIGAGGGSLPLLQKTGIKEARGYGGFPVSGQFLQCTNPEIVERHNAKIYGKASVGSPPMSVPHLDTRYINGKKSLFFGPYAGFSTRFLKTGSLFDLPGSLRLHNAWPLVATAFKNLPLTKYLVREVLQSQQRRFRKLQIYYPNAREQDWELITAGQRVQVIKYEKGKGSMLKFGTEIVSAEDGTVAALLGASPGASTSVSIMLEVLEKMFPNDFNSPSWQQGLREMIPCYGKSIIDDGELCLATRARTSAILGL